LFATFRELLEERLVPLLLHGDLDRAVAEPDQDERDAPEVPDVLHPSPKDEGLARRHGEELVHRAHGEPHGPRRLVRRYKRHRKRERSGMTTKCSA